MRSITGEKKQEWTIGRVLAEKPDGAIEIRGSIHNVRDMGDFAFVILRRYDGTVQCVLDEEKTGIHRADLPEGAQLSPSSVRSPGTSARRTASSCACRR